MNQQPCRTEAQNHMEQPKYKANNHPCYHDHNYGAPPPPTPPLSPTLIVSPQLRQNPLISAPLTAHDLSGMRALATVADHVRSGGDSLPSIVMKQDEDSRGSLISSGEEDNEQGLEGEETETAPEVDYDEDSVTRCICDFEHDDGYMICCDKCFVWQHVDCMGIDRDNIPEVYLCEKCQPRRVDRTRARNLQLRKKNHNDTSSSDDDNAQARKAAAANQVKKMNNNTGSKKRPVKKEMKKVVKRQKRDSAAVAAREQRANERRNNKKKESQNSNPVKTDSKKIAGRRRMSSKGKPESVVDEDTQDSWTSTVPLASQPQQVRNWIEQYEEAVTNHYSPELRARIQAIKVNGIHSDYRAGPVVLQKCRTTLGDAGVRVLLASAHLQPNQAIMEVRGKFMLVSQLVVKKSQLLSPYLLYYPLPKENTEVCVDARNFGNDARFARRSCKPNAELRHCIEKGALHLYLVAASSIEKNQEITIKHDDPVRIPCKHCPPLTPNPDSKKNGHIESHTEKGERRRRASRRNTEESVPEITPAPPVLQVNTPSPTTLTPAATPTPPAITPVVPSAPPTLVIQHPQTTPKKAPKSPVKQVPTPEKSQGEDSNDEDASINSPDKKKMTREERKMEAIMKAFERMEKQEQRKQAQQQHRRSERDSKDSDSSGRCRDEVENELDVVPPPKKKGRRTRGRSSSGASSQVLSADENSSGSHLVLSPGSASASASPRVVSSSPPLGFKFPKTKKVLMNEWLNKPEQPPLSPLKLEEGDGCIGGAAAAKKRWLRQAISEESEPPPSSSPRSASPDYLTPLKKRRLARESLEQHSCTPPATAASPELEADAALKQTPSLPLRCVEEAVMVLSGQMGIKLEPKEPSPPVLSPPPAIPAPSAQLATAPELPVALELPLPPPLPVSLAPPILPLSLLANPVPPPPPPLLLAAGPVDVNDIKEEAAPIPQPPPPAVAAPSPAAVKRKLSISEYRQRNKQKVEKTEPLGMDNNSPLGVDDDGKLIDGLDVKTEIPRWNSEPTSSEKQRENLTERLKREFGLFLDEQEKNEKDKVEEVLEQGPALPPLPPLEPPQPKVHDSLNIPLPSSPPPILDLLVMEPQPAPNLECPGSREEEDEFALRNGPSPLLIKSLTPAKMKASTKK